MKQSKKVVIFTVITKYKAGKDIQTISAETHIPIESVKAILNNFKNKIN